MHIARHPEERVGYVGVRDSATFVEFGNQQLSQPGRKAKLESRLFLNLSPEKVSNRKAMIGKVGTLTGIQSNYHYFCQPDGKVSYAHYLKKIL